MPTRNQLVEAADNAVLRIEEVDPERAYELLAHNTNNRSVRKPKVETYTRDMKARRWLPAGDPIHVIPDGEVDSSGRPLGLLGNGQHRLLAVIEANVTVRLPMLYASEEFRTVADQGMKRTFADILRIEYGEVNVPMLAVCVRSVAEYRRTGIISGKDTSSIAELTRTYLKERNIRESLYLGHSVAQHGIPIIPSIAATLHYLFSEIDPVDADAFFESLRSGANLSETNAIFALRRLMTRPERPSSKKIQSALVIKAFNLWRAGEEVRVLAWRGGGSNPEPYPVIAAVKG